MENSIQHHGVIGMKWGCGIPLIFPIQMIYKFFIAVPLFICWLFRRYRGSDAQFLYIKMFLETKQWEPLKTKDSHLFQIMRHRGFEPRTT